MLANDKNTPQETTLRVLLASAQRGWYGGEGQARLLALGLRTRGHEVHLLARRGEAFAQQMAEEGFPVIELANGGRSPHGILQARRAIRQLRPDVIHANDSHALTCLLLASFGIRVPARIASRRVTYPIRSPFQFRFFADRIACVATAVVEMCRAASLPEEKLALVFSSADPSRIETDDHEKVRKRGRDKIGLALDAPLLLCVGKLTNMKGHVDLLNAMPTVLAKHPNLLLALVGSGELLPLLQSQTEQLKIEPNVRFLGYRDDVPDLLQAADLYVQPSRPEGEGLCNAVIDAMFARCPVIVSTGGGLLDLIPPEQKVSGTFCAKHPSGRSGKKFLTPFVPLSSEYGWITPSEDPKRLAATILDALDTPKEQQRHRTERARARAMENFTADQMVERMLRVYRDAISSD